MSVELSSRILKRLGYTEVVFRTCLFYYMKETKALFPSIKIPGKKRYCRARTLKNPNDDVEFQTELKFSRPATAKDCLPIYEEIKRSQLSIMLWIRLQEYEDLAPKVLKYKDNSTFLVVIGTHVFEMNWDANMPNGLNLYLGEKENIIFDGYKRVGISKISQGMKIAIHQRMEQAFFELAETKEKETIKKTCADNH